MDGWSPWELRILPLTAWEARAQYLQRLETKLTSKELRYIFNMAVNRGYIIPHIDKGRVKYNTGQQSTSSENKGDDDLERVLLEEEEGDCAILTNEETRKKMKLNEPN